MTCKTIKYFGLALGLLLLVPSADAQTRTRGKQLRCSRVNVSSPEAASTRRRSRAKFSAAEIMDIQLQTLVSQKLTGRHSLELKIFTPNGNLYQSMKLQFDADAPLGNDGAQRASRYQEVNALLPVAGTSIVSSSMYGKWTVEAFLDGADQGCSRPRTFVIRP